MRLRISTAALDDHENRLYGHEDSTDTVKVHQDIVGAMFKIIKRTSTITVVDMSTRAITEFLDDADYQHEFNSDSYGDSMGRAFASVRKQIAKAGA